MMFQIKSLKFRIIMIDANLNGFVQIFEFSKNWSDVLTDIKRPAALLFT